MNTTAFCNHIHAVMGYAPDPVSVVPGEFVRFSTSEHGRDDAGWCRLFDDGEGGVFGNWRTGESHTWQARQAVTPEDRAEFFERVRRAQEDARKCEEERRAECRQQSAAIWSASLPATAHPYLEKKKVKAYGLRQDADGRLLVPVRDTEGILHGLQRIDAEGGKRFLSGTAVSGCYHPIGKPIGRLCIAEGYATGATIHEATGKAVAVAFNAGNLHSVAVALRAKYPGMEFVICADDDHATEGNPGITKATEAARAVSGKLAVPKFPESRGPKDSDFNDLARVAGLDTVRENIEAAADPPPNFSNNSDFSRGESSQNQTSEKNERLPLFREIPPAEPFPLEVFPRAMQAAAQRMRDVIQAPTALIGQSLLGAVTLAVQPHVDVSIDGRRFPVSENFITIAESGERKSACDREANRRVRGRQENDHSIAKSGKVELKAAQAAWDAIQRRIVSDKDLTPDEIRNRLNELGEKPAEPTVMKYTEEPTYEGLVKAFAEGNLSLGLYSDEGGKFFGGFAMNQDNALKTITGLSKLWDGDHITRSRGGDGNSLIYGVRLSVHLMIQPILADRVFGDPVLSGQGFLSRCLCSHPESTIGERPYQEVDLSVDSAMIRYHDRLGDILELPYPINAVGMGLSPRELNLSPAAKSIWIKFHDHIEMLQRDGQPLRPVKNLASKAAEHAARLAAVLTFFNKPDAGEIDAEHVEAGIELIQFYIGEALRLFNSATINPDLLLAGKVLKWANQPERGGLISLVDLYQRGPSQVRTKGISKKIIDILVEHNQVVSIKGGCKIGDTHRRDVWRVTDE